MLRTILTTAVVLVPFLAGAQNVVDSMSYGDNTIEWQVYATDAPVNAFAIAGPVLWYATDAGVETLNRKTGAKRAYPNLGDIASTGVVSIVRDKAGSIWLGTPAGVARHKEGRFTVYTTENGLGNNKVNRLAVSPSGDLWAATDNGVSLHKGGSWTTYTSTRGLPGDKVRDIAFDSERGVWLATNKGVGVYKDGTWRKHDMTNGLSSNDAKAIACDTKRGGVWVAVGEQDVNSYDGKKWDTYMDIQSDIRAIMVDTQSRIWFGSMMGVFKYNGIEWIMDPQKIGFPAAQACDMYRDSNGDLYFALESGVLHMSNPYPY